jgi:hypothetical protein
MKSANYPIDFLAFNEVILDTEELLYPGIPMIQSMPVNSVLIDTLTQIILSLNEQERQLLLHQLQDPHPTDPQSLQQKIEIGAQQMRNGEYTEYIDETLPELLGKIRSRGQNRLSKT